MNKGSLGRGLSSLIPSAKSQTSAHQHPQFKKDAIFYIEVDKIKTNPSQPRTNFNGKDLEDLAQSILRHGILQPLVVSKIEKDVESGRLVEYQLIAGERRLRAAKMIGMLEVPAIIKESAGSSRLEMALIENIQRKDLNPVEKAEAFGKLQKEHNFTHQKIADSIGKSREYITNLLRLLDLPDEIKKSIKEGLLSEGHARTLLAIKDPFKQKELYLQLLSNKISVRGAEDLARKIKKQPQIQTMSPYLKELVEKLEDQLGTKINLILKPKGGKMVIEFYSDEDLENIVKKISE